MPSAAIVFAAAPVAASVRLRTRLSQFENPYIVAADDGATTALAFRLRPNVVVGDLDSLDPSTRTRLEGVPIEQYPRDKDATDGQLAIERALLTQPTQLLLVGFLGGPRLDQWLANILLLTRVETPIVLLDEHNEATLLRPGADHAWRPEPDEIVSLIPLAGDVRGVLARGLKWPLNGETLRLGDTRGVSNEPVDAEVHVTIEAGLLLVTRHFPPDALSTQHSALRTQPL